MKSHFVIQEEQVNAAFSKQSDIFDSLEEHNPIIHWMRTQVREHLSGLLKPESTILELNAGTGIDAIYFAQQGFKVHATDHADGMLNVLREKVSTHNLQDRISVSKCSFNALEQLQGKKYDYIFSNFGGLNCAENIDLVIKKIDGLLAADGIATLVIMPPICPWELLSALKGNFKLAFRRFNKNGAKAHVEGIYFTSYYYTPSYIQKAFGNRYKVLAVKGLASISPPPYLEYFPKKFPRLYALLVKWDKKCTHYQPFHAWADHFIISIRKINSEIV